MSPTRRRDVLFHILYTDDMRTTMELCQASAQRLAKCTGDPLVYKLIEIASKSAHMARCVFILLLNVDVTLKEIVTRPFERPDYGLSLDGMCGYKAPIFFREIDKKIVPNFLRDELKLSVDFEREIQEMYQCS